MVRLQNNTGHAFTKLMAKRQHLTHTVLQRRLTCCTPQWTGSINGKVIKLDASLLLEIGPELLQQHLDRLVVSVPGGDQERGAPLAAVLHGLSERPPHGVRRLVSQQRVQRDGEAAPRREEHAERQGGGCAGLGDVGGRGVELVRR